MRGYSKMAAWIYGYAPFLNVIGVSSREVGVGRIIGAGTATVIRWQESKSSLSLRFVSWMIASGARSLRDCVARITNCGARAGHSRPNHLLASLLSVLLTAASTKSMQVGCAWFITGVGESTATRCVEALKRSIDRQRIVKGMSESGLRSILRLMLGESPNTASSWKSA